MIIDDDPDDREMLSEAVLLCNPESKYLVCKNAESALKFLQRHDSNFPDIVLLDVNMPRISGWEFLAELQQDPTLQSLHVVIMSTASLEREKQKAVKSGAFYFLVKPVTFDGYINEIEKISHLHDDLVLH